MLGLTSSEKQMALNYAYNGADFMFRPSTSLCNMIATGNPETMELNQTLVAILLTKKPIRLDTNTVIEYCKGTLDYRNTWLFDHGDIEVVSPKYKKPELTKDMEDSELDDDSEKDNLII